MNKKRLGEHLEKLATFKTVADLKSVHKAASRMGLSQPAVSRTVKVLESVLETQLLDRRSTGVQLTADGTRLYEYAKVIQQTLEDFDPAGTPEFSAERPLRIATYDNIACGVLSDLGPTFTEEFPQLSVIVGGPNAKILAELMSGKFDCALIAQPRILPGLLYKKMFTERYGIFIAKNAISKSSRKRNLRIEDLKDYKLIAMPDAIAGASKNIDRLLWEIGLESVISINSYEVAARMVFDGHGIGIMPLSSAWGDIRDGKIEELQVKELPAYSLGQHDLTFCWIGKNPHPKVRVFEKMLSQYYAKI